MNKTGISIAVVLAVAVGAGVVTYLAMTADKGETTTTSEQQVANTQKTKEAVQTDNTDTAAVAKVEIVFTDDGYDKEKYTVKAGETLLIKNDSSQTLQLSSDDHPTHTLNGELNASPVAPGETTELTPTTPGTYGIHDHIRSQFTTVVEVTE